MSSKVSICSSR